MDIPQIVKAQNTYFAKGFTKDVSFRLRALAKLRREILLRKGDILAALQLDLGKVPSESYMTELGLVLNELSYTMKNLHGWAQNKPVKTPLPLFPAQSFIQYEPYGLVLVMSPWNYPFMLSMSPLIGAIAAGNCVIVKPSAYAPATSSILRQIVEGCFAPSYVALIEGGRQENTALLEQRFDYIFFTGSVEVGKLVMEKASRNLTPVSLELGGKSPCIVDASANIQLAARRIAFGKFVNAGQTCIAPDYLLVHHSIKAPLLRAIEKEIHKFFGDVPLTSPELPKIVNEKHYNRLMGLIEGEDVYMGGLGDGRRITPTLLDNVLPTAPIMQEEIFGPILPVLTFEHIHDAVQFVNSREKPLALYLFTRNETVQRRVLSACSFGGGCVNDTVMHFANHHLPFGGVGHSGMGSYHGKKSFTTFSHQKSIVQSAGWFDNPVRYHPYSSLKSRLIEMFLT